MTQYLIEEAIWERLDRIESRVRALAAGTAFEDTDLGGGGGFESLNLAALTGGGGSSPGERQASDHAARMRALGAS